MPFLHIEKSSITWAGPVALGLACVVSSREVVIRKGGLPCGLVAVEPKPKVARLDEQSETFPVADCSAIRPRRERPQEAFVLRNGRLFRNFDVRVQKGKGRVRRHV